MNTRDLQYFVALVKYKNYTRVAKEFKASQPSITQAIQRLEREFNTQLVRKDRFHRDEMITRSGLLLYENAVLINDKIDLTRKEISRANQKQIRFGLPPIIGKLYISKIVEEFSGDLLSRLRITSVGSHDLLNQLRKGKIDIAILGSTTPINEDGIFAELVATRPFGIIVSKQNSLAQKDAVYFNELATQKFIKQIRFGLPPIIGKLYISKIVEEFSGDLLSRLRITSVGSHDLLNQLRKGKIDIAILGSTTPINEDGIFAELVATRPFGIIVSKQNSLAQKDAVYFNELATQKFINYDQQYVHQSAFQAYCTYAQIKPQIVVYRLPNISWIKELVRQDKGISLMVKDAATNEPGIKALDILDPIPEKFYISIVIREGYVLSDDEQDFIRRVKQIQLDN